MHAPINNARLALPSVRDSVNLQGGRGGNEEVREFNIRIGAR